MTTLNRNKLIAEELIRSHVRKRISEKLEERKKIENSFRLVIRKIITEAETGSSEAPSRSTGINVLASLLEKIVPILEDDYKMLTTSDEQRESFKNHIVQAVKNSLKPIDAPAAGELPENYEFVVDADMLKEKLKIDLDPEEDDSESVEGEFIDIDSDKEESEDFGSGLEDQNRTGRNFAASTFKKIETQIVDSFDMLADDEDKNIFYEYLLTNLLLYFDKFEDDITAEAPEQSTAAYEDEKDEEPGSDETEAEDTEELDLGV
tara:strand:- start:30 stop:818 length:789 start_codon:yes stop_codon:yes gene_type:complete